MKTLLMLAALALVGCNPAEQSPFSREPASTSSATSAPSRWNASKFPLAIEISEEFSADEDQAIRDMAEAWTDSVNQKTFFMDANYATKELGSMDLNAYEDGVIGVYKMSQWPSALPTTALAVTQIIGVRKNAGKSSEYIDILHADILVNYEIFAFTTDYSWGYDLQTIILHEMGHLLGLYHDNSSMEDSVMYPSIIRDVFNRFPKEKDIQNLEAKYGISRSGSSYAMNADRTAQENSQVSPQSADEHNEDIVVIQFEMMADGSENHIVK